MFFGDQITTILGEKCKILLYAKNAQHVYSNNIALDEISVHSSKIHCIS